MVCFSPVGFHVKHNILTFADQTVPIFSLLAIAEKNSFFQNQSIVILVFKSTITSCWGYYVTLLCFHRFTTTQSHNLCYLCSHFCSFSDSVFKVIKSNCGFHSKPLTKATFLPCLRNDAKLYIEKLSRIPRPVLLMLVLLFQR